MNENDALIFIIKYLLTELAQKNSSEMVVVASKFNILLLYFKSCPWEDSQTLFLLGDIPNSMVVCPL